MLWFERPFLQVLRREYAGAMRFDEDDAAEVMLAPPSKPCQLYVHVPFSEVLCPDKVSIILRADHEVQAVNWTGNGDWTYIANSNRRFLIQYAGEFEETGMKIYLNRKGRSNFTGRIWGTGFYSIGNPSDLDPAPVFCFYRGKAQ